MPAHSAPAHNPDSGRFDVIPYSDLSAESTWTRLGRGSFGCVFKGMYLGLDVAIKEVLNSDEYDVDKYFKRECTLMKECRHPNIVQFIGLCLAPTAAPDYLPPLSFDNSGRVQTKPPAARRRILIISEYLPNGNLRSHIVNQRLDFSWRLRLSFAVDVARAVAYLHARNCLHRDLKGENLLITENDRIKVCDFGFARLAAKNEDEMKRMSYCGTDGYMSPEILMGEEFGLETDIFSLGVIFCEIASRRLVDDHHFSRVMPTFGLDEEEIRSRASEGCPGAFLDMAIACVQVEPADRPKIRSILDTLRSVERTIIEVQSASGGGYNVGSLTFGARHAGRKSVSGSKSVRPSGPGRIPSFQGQIVTPSYGNNGNAAADDSSSDEDVEETIAKLETLKVGNGAKGSDFYLNPLNAEATSRLLVLSEDGSAPVKSGDDDGASVRYSVIKPSRHATGSSFLSVDDQGSVITVRGLHDKGSASTSSAITAKSAFAALPSSWMRVATATAHQMKEEEEAEDRREQETAASEKAGPDEITSAKESRNGEDEGDTSATTFASASSESSESEAPTTPTGGDVPKSPTLQVETSSKDDIMPGTLPVSKFATIKSLSTPCPASPETMGQTSPGGSGFTDDGPSPHRFTLIRPGWRALWEGNAPYVSEKAANKRLSAASKGDDSKRSSIDSTHSAKDGVRKSTDGGARPAVPAAASAGILPMQLLGAGLLTRCQVCEKRLGLMKPYLHCDDCAQIFHVKCGDLTSADCRGLNHRHIAVSADSAISSTSTVSSAAAGSSASISKDKMRKAKRESKKLHKTTSATSSYVVV